MSEGNPREAKNKRNNGGNNGPSPINAEPLLVTIEPQSNSKHSYQAKHYRLDRARYRLEKKAYKTAHWTMVFLIVYTGLTLVLAVSSIVASYAAQKQSSLMRQQLVDTESASVQMEVPNMGKNSLGGVTNIQFLYTNVGKVRTRNLCSHFSVTRSTLPDEKPIGSPLEWVDCPVEIQPTSPDLSNNGRIERAIPYALTKDDASALFTADETVKIAGNISYDNGFGEQIVMPVCYEFLSWNFGHTSGEGFQTCGAFPLGYAEVRKGKQQSPVIPIK